LEKELFPCKCISRMTVFNNSNFGGMLKEHVTFNAFQGESFPCRIGMTFLLILNN